MTDLNLQGFRNLSSRNLAQLLFDEKAKMFHEQSNDEIVKSPLNRLPAKAGVQKSLVFLDSGFRRNDRKRNFRTFYEGIKGCFKKSSSSPLVKLFYRVSSGHQERRGKKCYELKS